MLSPFSAWLKLCSFRSNYVFLIVADGYGFSSNQTFTIVDSVDGHKVHPHVDVYIYVYTIICMSLINYTACVLSCMSYQLGWALGSMLYEINGLPFVIRPLTWRYYIFQAFSFLSIGQPVHSCCCWSLASVFFLR
jgi:hypothetical protein